MISTKTYLIRKKELEDSIGWYAKTIASIDGQQTRRKFELNNLLTELNELERNYTNGT